MVYDSSMAVEGTTKKNNVLFDEADLAGIVLNLVPVIWVNQYNMMHSILPKSPRALLPDLEAFKHVKHVMSKKHQASLKAKAKEVPFASASTKGSSKKRSTSGNPGVLFTYYLCTAQRLTKLVTQIRFTSLLGICFLRYSGASGLT